MKSKGFGVIALAACAKRSQKVQMHLELDHLVVAAETLDEGTAFVQDTLGVALSDIGHHAHMGTHNRLLSLGSDVYFEVIAIDPEADPPKHPRWFNLDSFAGPPRLTNWVCRTTSLDVALAQAPDGTGQQKTFERNIFRWRMAVPENGQLPYDGAMPALIQWETSDHPAPLLQDVNVRLKQFSVSHPKATNLAEQMPALAQLPGISLQAGPECAFAAEFETPLGTKVLR